MWKKLVKKWDCYKYRFVPWLAVNINESSPRLVPIQALDKLATDDHVVSYMKNVFYKFHQNHKDLKSIKQLQFEHESNLQSMLDELGFKIGRRDSLVPDAGRGVFVTEGNVSKGALVAIYPGVVYQPWEPVFLVSIANSFLFRCADGVHIDGKDKGLSRYMYSSCAGRDKVFGELTCDTSWMGENPVNPLAIGQYVNNQTNDLPANVAYQEIDIPVDFPAELRKYIPNIEAKLQHDMEINVNNDRLLKLVVLVAVRNITMEEELYSTYYTIVQKEPPFLAS